MFIPFILFVGFTQKIHVHAGLEHHHDIAAAEQEVTHGIAFFNPRAHLDGILPVAGADLGHSDGEDCHQTVIPGVDDDAIPGFNHLPAGYRVQQNVALGFRIPFRDAAGAVDGGDLAHLFDGAADREMVV